MNWTPKFFRLANRQGMTLVEMMVALSIFAVAMVVIFTFLVNSRRTYTDISDKVEYQQSARATLSLISQEIRSAGCNPQDALFDNFPLAGDQGLWFRRDLNGNGVIEATSTPAEDIYYLYQNVQRQLWRRGGDGSGWQILLRNMNNFGFAYFDGDGNQLGPGWLTPQQRDEIRWVEINVDGESASGEQVNFETRVALRNG